MLRMFPSITYTLTSVKRSFNARLSQDGGLTMVHVTPRTVTPVPLQGREERASQTHTVNTLVLLSLQTLLTKIVVLNYRNQNFYSCYP